MVRRKNVKRYMEHHSIRYSVVAVNRSHGFITLLSVLVVGVIGVATALSLLFMSIGSSNAGLATLRSSSARALANSCAEEALEQIHNAPSFTGTGTLSNSEGMCIYTVTTLGGQNRLIEATGTVATVVRKIRVNIDRITPRIQVVSWQEVAD